MVVITDGVFSKFRKEITDRRPIVNSSFAGLVLKNVNVIKFFSILKKYSNY